VFRHFSFFLGVVKVSSGFQFQSDQEKDDRRCKPDRPRHEGDGMPVERPTTSTTVWPEIQGQSGRFARRMPIWSSWTTGPFTPRKELDHIMHSGELLPLRARVLDRGRSDHLPLIATFARAGVDR